MPRRSSWAGPLSCSPNAVFSVGVRLVFLENCCPELGTRSVLSCYNESVVGLSRATPRSDARVRHGMRGSLGVFGCVVFGTFTLFLLFLEADIVEIVENRLNVVSIRIDVGQEELRDCRLAPGQLLCHSEHQA